MYQQIAQNKRNTYLLILCFIIIIMIIAQIIGIYSGFGHYALLFAAIFSIVMVLTSFFNGDKIIMVLSKAKKIEKKDNPQLFNVVEEMSISSGLPMPNIYVIDEQAPNAFATGRKPEIASVAVTTGLIQKLNRSQLQGVIAHEMSHIKNYDILYCTIIAVLVGVIAMLCDVMMRSFFFGSRSRSRSSKGGGGGGIIVLVGILFAIIAPLLAQIIRFSVSRQREYLADASSVELTRNPEGLAGALERIAGDPNKLKAANRATQHLYIVNPLKPLENRSKNNIFSTHPPIEERISRLRHMA